MKLKELIKTLADGNPDGLTMESYLQEDFIPNTLLKSDTLQQSFGISDGEMEDYYRQGYEFYQKDQFAQAVSFFHWLVVFNPFVPRYWMGLGACRQFLKEYEKALQAYAVAALVDDADPYPHFHAHECYIALGDREEAIKALASADECASSHPVHQSLRIKIGKIISDLKSELKL